MLAKPDKGGLTEEQIAFLRNPAAAKPAAPKADPVVAKFVADALKPGAVVGKATPEFVAALSAEVRANGDAAKGAAVFKKAELGCTACHKIGNDGGTIGPDLNNIGSAQPLDFIIGAVIEPSREIKEGFEARIVTTKSGGTFTGFRRASAPDELALFDGATGKETKLKLTDITDNKPLGSLMPAGLVEKLALLTEAETLLTETDRSKARTTLSSVQRRWDAIGMARRSRTSPTARCASANAVSVCGLAPASEFAIVMRPYGWRAITFGRALVDV